MSFWSFKNHVPVLEVFWFLWWEEVLFSSEHLLFWLAALGDMAAVLILLQVQKVCHCTYFLFVKVWGKHLLPAVQERNQKTDLVMTFYISHLKSIRFNLDNHFFHLKYWISCPKPATEIAELPEINKPVVEDRITLWLVGSYNLIIYQNDLLSLINVAYKE